VKVWTIYEQPLDFPAGYVVREYTVAAGKVETGEAQYALTLLQARALVPSRLYCVQREEHDDPSVVETWL
jgi:hypothetical protein